jgi:hypothetical protein
MNPGFRKMIGLGCLTAALLVASVSILPTSTATAGEETVDGIDKVKTTGENISATCDTTSSNLDKRGKLAYDKDTGSLKFEVSTAEEAK